MSSRAHRTARPGKGDQLPSATRRDFLKGAATLAAGVVAAPALKAEAADSLPTIDLCGHKVTRLIAGANPLYGYSHFNMIVDAAYLEYFTDDQVVRFMQSCEKAGINSWQGNFAERAQRQYPKIRDAGVKMKWICLADPWDAKVQARTPDEQEDAIMRKVLAVVVKAKPIVIAHHGNVTDNLFRAGKLDRVLDFLKKVHDMGFPNGVSTHNPRVVEVIEEKGWPVDYYQCCFYCQSREKEDYMRDIGVAPVGEAYLASDPPRMCAVLQKVSKPCLAFKILAAGRACTSPQAVRGAFNFAFENIKPADAVIVGMFPKYKDQIAENTGIVRELCA